MLIINSLCLVFSFSDAAPTSQGFSIENSKPENLDEGPLAIYGCTSPLIW